MKLQDLNECDLERNNHCWIVTEEHLPLRVIGTHVTHSSKGTPGTITRDVDKSVTKLEIASGCCIRRF